MWVEFGTSDIHVMSRKDGELREEWCSGSRAYLKGACECLPVFYVLLTVHLDICV
jgi:hypothetical protein